MAEQGARQADPRPSAEDPGTGGAAAGKEEAAAKAAEYARKAERRRCPSSYPALLRPSHACWLAQRAQRSLQFWESMSIKVRVHTQMQLMLGLHNTRPACLDHRGCTALQSTSSLHSGSQPRVNSWFLVPSPRRLAQQLLALRAKPALEAQPPAHSAMHAIAHHRLALMAEVGFALHLGDPLRLLPRSTRASKKVNQALGGVPGCAGLYTLTFDDAWWTHGAVLHRGKMCCCCHRRMQTLTPQRISPNRWKAQWPRSLPRLGSQQASA